MPRIRVLLPVFLLLMTAADLSAQAGGPVYIAYFWRAKPGMIDQYNDYITGTAEKIDEDARKAGVFDQRKRNSERSATLRDFVRQEIWTTLR